MSNRECGETVCHCNVKENAELIAKIMDCDVDGKVCTDVVEVEPLKNYITNLISNTPQTDYVKDDYDAGFADALRIIYTHLCGERRETNG